MAQDSKRGLFNAVFGAKRKTEEDLQAERESRLKLEERIREVLIVSDPPNLEQVMECTRDSKALEIDTAEITPVPLFPAAPAPAASEPEYTFMYLSTGTESQRKQPSSARLLQSLAPAQASQAH
jgi:hypothetical protein